jgi:hypothetical protein
MVVSLVPTYARQGEPFVKSGGLLYSAFAPLFTHGRDKTAPPEGEAAWNAWI